MQNSPVAYKIKLPEHTVRWRSVSTGDVDVYVPMNVPIKTTSRSFVFEQLSRTEMRCWAQMNGLWRVLRVTRVVMAMTVMTDETVAGMA